MDAHLNHDLRVYTEPDQLMATAAAAVAHAARTAVARHGHFTMALAGGSTPKPLYAALVQSHAEAIPWPHVHLFWGDERYVPHEDAQSNYRMAKDALLAHVPVPPTQVYPMPTGHARPEDAATAYAATLRDVFGGEMPRFDLILLGLGTDGHTASLFPGTPALDEAERWVVAAEAPAAPTQRLTLTFPVLNHAALVYVLTTGAGKSEAVRCALGPHPDVARCPASGVRPESGGLVWWLDRAAARLLDTEA